MKKWLLLLGLACFACSADDVAAFFRTAPNELEQKLPADKVFPQGRLFPFSFYSTGGGTEAKRGDLLPAAQRAADEKQIIEAGVTMIGPQYELNDSSLDVAKKYNVKMVFSIVPKVDGVIVDREYLKRLTARKEKLDVAKVKASVAEIVKAVADRPEIAWWDITPEEMRFWVPNELEYLKTAYETVKENDPLKRPVFMYEPQHRSADDLVKLLPYQDLCVKGTYVNHSAMKTQRVWVRHSIELQGEAVKAMKDGRERYVIALPEMFQQPSAEELKMIPAWVRHDVYASLVNGAKGVLVFSASRRPEFAARQAYLDAYLKVCGELTGKLQLGQVFLFGEKKSDVECSIMSGPQQVTMTKGKVTQSYSPVSFACYSWHNKRYVFLVNSANEPVKAVVGGMVYASNLTVRDLLRDTPGFTAPEGEFIVELDPLEAVVFEIYPGK